MRPTRNIRLLIIGIVLAVAGGFCLSNLTGCAAHTVTLEAGGAYTDPYLATTDQAILDAAKTLDGFTAWYAANATFLARYPEVGQLADSVRTHQSEWIRNAYAARDAYAEAAAAYRSGKAGPPSTARVNAALAVINDVAKQIVAYRSAHP